MHGRNAEPEPRPGAALTGSTRQPALQRQLDVAHGDRAERDLVAAGQVNGDHMLAVDACSVRAAPVKQARALRALDDDRMQPREAAIVDTDVGRQAPADVRDLLAERDQPRAVFVGE